MKKILLLIIIFSLQNCKPKNNEPLSSKADSLSVLDSAEIAYATEGQSFSKLQLPDNVTLDTLQSYDSAKLINVNIVLPKQADERLKHVEKLVARIISKERTKFEKSVDDMIREHPEMNVPPGYNDFSVTPVSLYVDQKLISYSFMICIYHAGAPHGKCDYYTFNYDIYSKKVLLFSDYFITKTSADSSFLIQSINNSIGRDGIEIEKVYEIDFSILDSTSISFNFDNYEISSYAEGMPQGKIEKKVIYKIVNERFR
jgi:hypothetical protein